MRVIPLLIVAGAGLFADAALSQSKIPVAVVEDVSPSVVGVGFMDYVSAGDKIKLAPTDTLALGYMKSCVRETILGGMVTVGREQSDVVSGTVARSKVNCDGGRMQLTSAQSNSSAGMAFRAPPTTKASSKTSKIQLTLFGTSPMFDVANSDSLTVERIDLPGERLVMKLKQDQLVRGKFVDFAEAGISLVPGGVYRSRLKVGEVVFRIDTTAQPGRTPAIGRLVRFGAAL
jgi:hypothetical protein